MANPTTLVASFSGTPDGFTPSGPERYRGGLYLEEAGTNLITNPAAATNATGWTALTSGFTATRVTSFPAFTGDLAWLNGRVTTAIQVATSTPTSGQVLQIVGSPTLTAAPHVCQVLAYIPASFGPTGFSLATDLTQFVGASEIVTAQANMALRDQWQVVGPAKVTPVSGDLIGSFYLNKSGAQGTWGTGDTIYLVLADIKPGAYLTSPVAASMAGGYSSSPSPHSRAASSASVATANHLDPSSGAIAFRFRRLIDTGGVEPIIECGTDGDDWFKAYIDADKLVAWWSSGGALPQYVTSVESIAVDTEYFIYIEWEGNTQALSINNGAKVVGSRDSVTGSWGAGDLVLKAE